MKEVDRTVVVVPIKDEVEVVELVKVMDRLFAKTMARKVTSQETIRILL